MTRRDDWQSTGMPIPLNSLRQWILGLPGDATDYKLDDQYRLSEITYSQNGKLEGCLWWL